MISLGIVFLVSIIHFAFNKADASNKSFKSFYILNTGNSVGSSQEISEKTYFDLILQSTIDTLESMPINSALKNSFLLNVQLQLRGLVHYMNDEQSKYLNLSKRINVLTPVYLINTGLIPSKSSSFLEKLFEQISFRFIGEDLSFKNGFITNESYLIQQSDELNKLADKYGFTLNSVYLEQAQKIKSNYNTTLSMTISYLLLFAFWGSSFILIFLWLKNKILKKEKIKK